jgi:hypothetical protein
MKHACITGAAALALATTLLLAPALQAAQPDGLEPAVRTSTAAAPAAPPAAVPAPASAPDPTTTGAARPGRAAASKPRAAAATASGDTQPAAGTAPAGSARARDRVDLDTTQITGNRELPNVMYVVPWKKPELGEFSGRPPKSLLDELLAPVDREVFQRQNRYYSALKPDAAVPQGAGGSAVGSSPQGDRVPAAPSRQNAADER